VGPTAGLEVLKKRNIPVPAGIGTPVRSLVAILTVLSRLQIDKTMISKNPK